jgi:hypothetical protein
MFETVVTHVKAQRTKTIHLVSIGMIQLCYSKTNLYNGARETCSVSTRVWVAILALVHLQLLVCERYLPIFVVGGVVAR